MRLLKLYERDSKVSRTADPISEGERGNEMKEKNMCLSEGCYNDKEYGSTITYWQDKWGNERFNAPILDVCLQCKIMREKVSV